MNCEVKCKFLRNKCGCDRYGTLKDEGTTSNKHLFLIFYPLFLLFFVALRFFWNLPDV